MYHKLSCSLVSLASIASIEGREIYRVHYIMRVILIRCIVNTSPVVNPVSVNLTSSVLGSDSYVKS